MLRIAFFFLLAFLSTVVAAASCPDTGTQLQVLGSGGPGHHDHRAGSAYLVWINGKSRILVNAGNGSSLRFQESGARFEQLDVIALSRLHADQTAGLPGIVSAARTGNRSRALPVFGPDGSKTMPSTVAFVRALFDQRRGVWRELGSVLSPLGTKGFKLRPHDIRTVIKGGKPELVKAQKANPIFNNGALRLSAAAGTFANAPVLSWRVHTGTGSIVFISDTPGTGLQKFAKGADILVAHIAANGTGDAGRNRAATPEELGRLAAASGIKHLVLARRMDPGGDKEKATVQKIKQSFGGKISLAEDLACYQIGKP
jgi:ribonuclease BN (tRNA processing enzyme)